MKRGPLDSLAGMAVLVVAVLLISSCTEPIQVERAEPPTSSVDPTSSEPVDLGSDDTAEIAPDAAPAPDAADLVPFPGFGIGTVMGADEPLPVLVAETSEQRRQGLMGVSALDGWSGMWFVFPEPTSGGFWMKDTLLPLSIAWIDRNGTVVATADMEPCTADPCPSYAPDAEYISALEVEQGQLDELGVGLGTQLALSR